MTKHITLSEAKKYSEKVGTEFAREAYEYSSDLKCNVLALEVDNKLKGLIYYRRIDENLFQLVNFHSEIKGGGTELFHSFCNLCRIEGVEFIYFYITEGAGTFYDKFGIEPLNDGDYRLAFIDVEVNNRFPIEYTSFIKEKLNKL